jgi:tRNA U38,U39,U40 pseudouridine synthase TruA
VRLHKVLFKASPRGPGSSTSRMSVKRRVLRLNIMLFAVHSDAAALFQGTHDFTQFANLSPANEYRHPVKRLSRCEVVDLPDGFRVEVVPKPRCILK